MAYEVNDNSQKFCLASGILDKFAKQLATISRITQKELHEVLGYGSAATIFALTDQAVVRALAFDASVSECETLVPVANSIARRIPPVASSMNAHQLNCNRLGLPVHSASVSNVLTRSMKKESEFKAERNMHTAAGKAKHSFEPERPTASSTTIYLENLLPQGDSSTDEQHLFWESRVPRCRRNRVRRNISDRRWIPKNSDGLEHVDMVHDATRKSTDGCTSAVTHWATVVHKRRMKNLREMAKENVEENSNLLEAGAVTKKWSALVHKKRMNHLKDSIQQHVVECPFEVGQLLLTASRTTSMRYTDRGGGIACNLFEKPCKVLELPDEDHPNQVRIELEFLGSTHLGWMPIPDLQSRPP